MQTSNRTNSKKSSKTNTPDIPTENHESSLKNPYHLLSINKSDKKHKTNLLKQRLNTDIYQSLTDKLLHDLYPKSCSNCNIPVTTIISTRPSVLRCTKCNKQISRFKHTPLENIRIPSWMFGYILHESVLQYPKALTSTEIQKKLGIAYNTALLLKRRLQLFSIDMMPKVKNHFHSILNQKPISNLAIIDRHSNTNTKESILPNSSTPIVNADTMVLFSASQRANKGRKRHRHGGQTASIYLSDSLGGTQIGSLVHTIAIKGGGVIYQYITDQTANSLGSQISEFIPKHSYLFTDEGYPFLEGIYTNHRMVNHSLKSRDKRYRFSGNRWCQNGIHNQVAEGYNNNLKDCIQVLLLL
jgi:hypothetical protein